MARLQILELPTEHHGDDMVTPFVLVIDQASEEIAKALTPAESGEVSYATAIKRLTGLSTAEQIGARAVLIFEEAVEIPANSAAYLAQAEEQAEDERINERAIQAEEKLKAFMDKRYDIEQGRKTSLLDALGMDHTRDWDDIVNAVRGMRGQIDAARERDANQP